MNCYSYHFLSHNPKIKKALFCIDAIESISTIDEIINESCLDEIYLYIKTNNIGIKLIGDKFSDKKVTIVDDDTIFDIKFNDKNLYVFCFNLENKKAIDAILKAKPYNVVFDYDHVKKINYNLWERFRLVSHTVKIAVMKSEISYKILDWEKKDDENIELSVIFPMYKVEEYLPKLIENITKWKAPYVEFVFVSDGSPDHSADIVRSYQQKDPRIKLFEKPNGGCASAREYGLTHSTGRYVGFIDPDDFTDETMLKKLLFKALSGSYDIAYCGYNEYYNDTGKIKPIYDFINAPYDNGTEDRDAIDELIPFMRVGIWRMIFRRAMLEENNIHFYTDLKRFDDLPFKVETLKYCKSVVSVPEHLYYYRLARVGQDIAANDERLYVHFDIFKYLDEDFKTKTTSKQLDLYHVVKICTHGWALAKLKPEFVKPYLSSAKVDLLSLYNKKQLKNVVAIHCRNMKKTLRKILRAK